MDQSPPAKRMKELPPGVPLPPNEENKEPDNSDFAPIEKLPKELSDKILDLATSNLVNLAQASPILESLVAQFVCEPSRVRTVKDLRFFGSAQNGGPLRKMEVRVGPEHVTYFELMLKNIELPPLMKRQRTDYCDAIFEIVAPLIEDHDAIRALLKHTCRNVEKVSLRYFNHESSLDIVSILLKDSVVCPVLDWVIDTVMSDSAMSFIKSTINNNNVKEIDITVARCTLTDPVKNLLELSDLLRSVRITQIWINGLAKNSKYFFGLHDEHWPSIITDMFSRKIEKIYFYNNYYPYLTLNNYEELMKQLPKLGKKISFESSCDFYLDGLAEEIHDDKNDLTFIIFRPASTTHSLFQIYWKGIKRSHV